MELELDLHIGQIVGFRTSNLSTGQIVAFRIINLSIGQIVAFRMSNLSIGQIREVKEPMDYRNPNRPTMSRG
jgi:hypothetical protein